MKIENIDYVNGKVEVKSTSYPKGEYGYFSFNDELTSILEFESETAEYALHLYKLTTDEYKWGDYNIFVTELPDDTSLRNILMHNTGIVVTDKLELKLLYYEPAKD